jgi:hypothetical protein
MAPERAREAGDGGDRRLLQHGDEPCARVRHHGGHGEDERSASRDYHALPAHVHPALHECLPAADPHHTGERPPGIRDEELARARRDHDRARAHRRSSTLVRDAHRAVARRIGDGRQLHALRARAIEAVEPAAREARERAPLAVAPHLATRAHPLVHQHHARPRLGCARRRRDSRGSAAHDYDIVLHDARRSIRAIHSGHELLPAPVSTTIPSLHGMRHER